MNFPDLLYKSNKSYVQTPIILSKIVVPVGREPRAVTRAHGARNVANDDETCHLIPYRSARDGVHHQRRAALERFVVVAQKREGAQTV